MRFVQGSREAALFLAEVMRGQSALRVDFPAVRRCDLQCKGMNEQCTENAYRSQCAFAHTNRERNRVLVHVVTEMDIDCD